MTCPDDAALESGAQPWYVADDAETYERIRRDFLAREQELLERWLTPENLLPLVDEFERAGGSVADRLTAVLRRFAADPGPRLLP